MLRQRWRLIQDRFATMDVPPFVKLGLLVAVAVLPFAAFVALQDNGEEEPDPAPIQQAIDTSQQVPLLFPFGGAPDPVAPIETPETVEMSPSPVPTPTKSPVPAQCANAKDDDKDGKVDLRDPGCSSRTDKTESPDPASPKPPAPPVAPPAPVTPPVVPPAPVTPPVPPPVPPAPVSPPPVSPTPPRVPLGECDDGIDNDHDGKIDLADVPSCHGDPTDDE